MRKPSNTGIVGDFEVKLSIVKDGAFCFLHPFVKRCTPLTCKTYLSLKSIGIVKRFGKTKGSLGLF
jgi:hypothetical protein